MAAYWQLAVHLGCLARRTRACSSAALPAAVEVDAHMLSSLQLHHVEGLLARCIDSGCDVGVQIVEFVVKILRVVYLRCALHSSQHQHILLLGEVQEQKQEQGQRQLQ